MNKETNIDCMKYRKSTHLAGVDVEAIIVEKGNCILTIKEVCYEKGVDVSGNKTDGYFAEFVEDVKPMVLNSTNRKAISTVAKNVKALSNVDSRNIGQWAGLQIELYFDESVKMMGKVVGGIKVKPEAVVLTKKPISDANFEKALKAIEAGTYTKEKLESDYSLTSTQKMKI